MASSRLVLPWPLSPESTLKRGEGSSVSGARLRNAWSWRARRSKSGGARSDAHRHDDAEVVRSLGRPHDARIELAAQLQADLLGRHLPEEVAEVLGVEADAERRAGVADLEFLLDLAELRVVAGDLEGTLADAELDPAGLPRH